MSGPKIPDRPTRPGGARWCEEHGQWECTKPRSKGRGTCHGVAISGTDACRMHAGVPLEVAKAQGQARITAFSALGATPAVEPGYAVLASLHMSWLRVHLYARLLEEQVQGEHGEPVGSWNGDLDVDEDGYARGVARQQSPAGAAGLIGHTFAADKLAGVFASAEAVRSLVQLEAQERDRAVRYAKVAHDMGIAEREVRLAERQGEMLAQVIRNVLGDLDLTDAQQQLVPDVVGRHLRAVAEIEATGGAA